MLRISKFIRWHIQFVWVVALFALSSRGLEQIILIFLSNKFLTNMSDEPTARFSQHCHKKKFNFSQQFRWKVSFHAEEILHYANAAFQIFLSLSNSKIRRNIFKVQPNACILSHHQIRSYFWQVSHFKSLKKGCG